MAAGLGTRLGELGRTTPKALVTVGERTMLEHVARRLVDAGVGRIIVNVHHHADRLAQWVGSHDLGAEVMLSIEEEYPLETGGGLRHACRFLQGTAPFFMHNVDVLAGADLGALMRAHQETGALATLAVSARPSERRLLFDDGGLYGRVDASRGTRTEVRPPRGRTYEWPFSGIHVASPELPGMIVETGVFPIFDVYMRLAAGGARIVPYDIGGVSWFEVGTPERLAAAREANADETRPRS